MNRHRRPISLTLLCLLVAFFLAPLCIMLIGGFKNEYALMKIPPDLNPFMNMTLGSYATAFSVIDLGLGMRNSLISSFGSVAVNLLVCATAGYVFAKKRFPGKSLLFSLVIATMIIPRQILLVPNYIVADNLNLTDTLLGLILTSVAPSFGIFLCRQFMRTIPDEIMEAAQMDGCGELQGFLKILIPMSVPALGALAIFTFMGAWNDYLWAFIFIGDKEKMTLPVVVAGLSSMQKANTGARFAASTLSFIPMLVIFMSFQRFFIEGITMGSVKG